MTESIPSFTEISKSNLFDLSYSILFFTNIFPKESILNVSFVLPDLILKTKTSASISTLLIFPTIRFTLTESLMEKLVS